MRSEYAQSSRIVSQLPRLDSPPARLLARSALIASTQRDHDDDDDDDNASDRRYASRNGDQHEAFVCVRARALQVARLTTRRPFALVGWPAGLTLFRVPTATTTTTTSTTIDNDDEADDRHATASSLTRNRRHKMSAACFAIRGASSFSDKNDVAAAAQSVCWSIGERAARNRHVAAAASNFLRRSLARSLVFTLCAS